MAKFNQNETQRTNKPTKGHFNNKLMAKLKQGGLVSDQHKQVRAKRFDDNYQKFTLVTLDNKTIVLAIKRVDKYSFTQPMLLSVSQTDGVYDDNYQEPVAGYFNPSEHNQFISKAHDTKQDMHIWIIKHIENANSCFICSRKHLENNRVIASFFTQCDNMRAESDKALKDKMPNLLALRQGIITAEKNRKFIFNPNTSLPDELHNLARYDAFSYSYLLLQRLYDDFYDDTEITELVKITIDLLFSKQTTIDSIRKNIDVIVRKI